MKPLTTALWIALVAMLALPSAAGAQSRAQRRQAGESFRAGEAAFEENDNEAALELFRRAFELAPNDVVRFNIAVCLERLGRFREAAEEYDAANASGALSRRDRGRAEQAAVRARQRLGTVVVLGPEDGAAVSIDGEALCEVPCEEALDPGVHWIEVVGSDGAQTIEVERGGRSELRFERPAPAPPPEPQITPTAPDLASPTQWTGPGPLTVAGAIVAVLGGTGIVAFGLLAEDEHNAYLEGPTTEARDRGLLYRDLSNASIAVAALGGVLVLVDLIFFAPAQVPSE
ncbi:MAG: tetratricopeptide repeat protein [Sandaracinaceae bacterium]